MKKFLFFVFAATIFAACEKETAVNDDPITTPEEGLVTYTFSVSQEALEDTDVKATISDAGVFEWEDGDQIAIYNTVDSKYYLFSTSDTGSTADFTRDAAAGANFTVAYYPASIVMSAAEISAGVSASAVGSTTSITLPSTYASAAAASAGFPMSGTVDALGALSMSHLGGMLRFSFTNVPTQATELVVSAGSGISGAFTVASDKISTTGTGTVTISFSKGSTSVFSVPVPTGDYSSITVSLKDSNHKELFGKTKSTKTTVARKKLWKVASVNAKGEEFYVTFKGNSWSLSNATRMIKTGSNTYCIAGYAEYWATDNDEANKHNSNAGYKIIPGYYLGTSSWSDVYGTTANAYTGSLVFGNNNCKSGWNNGTNRKQRFTINMSGTPSYTTEDLGEWSSGASNLYLLGDAFPGGWSFIGETTLQFTTTADHNFELKNVTISAGDHYFKLHEEWNNNAKFWGEGTKITTAAPYNKSLTYHGSASAVQSASFNLEAGTYNIYFCSAETPGYIWFEKQ